MMRTHHATQLLLLGAAAALAVLGISRLRPAEAVDTTVLVGDEWFCDASFENGVCETSIDAGDTVTWDFGPSTLAHTSTHCDTGCDLPPVMPVWDSGLRTEGTFEFTFVAAGTFAYRCDVHPLQMRGRIVVGGGGPTPPPPATTPTRTRTPTPATPPAGCTEGDANNDGSVTSVDAAIDLQYSAGLLQSLACFAGADVNDDGQVTSVDAALILQFVAGLLDEL